jgi:5'-nucleotidase
MWSGLVRESAATRGTMIEASSGEGREGERPSFLLTNDDGIDAPGIEALRVAVEGLGRSFVVAPRGPLSGCGHRVTTHQPIAVEPRGVDRFAVDGTPADCVRLALHHLTSDVTCVLAGINAGGNLGTDVHHSGTVAAVREAVIRGRPGIALSHYIARGRTIDWNQAARWTRRVLNDLLARPWRPGTFWNVNLPHPDPGGDPEPEIVFCPLDPSPLPLAYRVEGNLAHYEGDYQGRARRTSSDVDVCFQGRIAVSLVAIHLPDEHLEA